MNDGATNWGEDQKAGWMTDAPLNEWRGVTADEDDNVTELDLGRNSSLTGIAVFNIPPFYQLTRFGCRFA